MHSYSINADIRDIGGKPEIIVLRSKKKHRQPFRDPGSEAGVTTTGGPEARIHALGACIRASGQGTNVIPGLTRNRESVPSLS